MDPASASLGFLSVGLTLAQSLYTYCKDYKKWKTEPEVFKQYVSILRAAFAQLKEICGDEPISMTESQALKHADEVRSRRNTKHSVDEKLDQAVALCEEVVVELADFLRNVKPDVAPDERPWLAAFFRKFSKRSMYPLQRPDLSKITEKLHRFADALQIVIGVRTLSSIRDLHLDVKQLRKDHTGDRDAASLETLRKCLRPVDTSTDFEVAYGMRYPNTCLWLMEGEAFRTWLSHDSSFLWVYGSSGCGKSVLSSAVIAHVSKPRLARLPSYDTTVCNEMTTDTLSSTPATTIAVAYFFFKQEKEHNREDLIRSLFFQLVEQLGPNAESLHEQTIADIRQNVSIDTKMLMPLLEPLIKQFGNVYIVIDAINESFRPNEVIKVLRKIRDWSIPTLHLFITSQDHSDIRAVLKITEKESIWMNANDDIKKYIDGTLDSDDFIAFDRDCKNLIRSKLNQRADGAYGSFLPLPATFG